MGAHKPCYTSMIMSNHRYFSSFGHMIFYISIGPVRPKKVPLFSVTRPTLYKFPNFTDPKLLYLQKLAKNRIQGNIIQTRFIKDFFPRTAANFIHYFRYFQSLLTLFYHLYSNIILASRKGLFSHTKGSYICLLRV